VAEHAPRFEPQYLYREEVAMGWDVAKIQADFEAYAAALRGLATEFDGRLTVLRGFEAEVVPSGRYAEEMLGLRTRLGFEYIVGSVHWVDDAIIDYTQAEFDTAVAAQGGLERLAVRYYETVAEMVRALRPEVVGHLDVLRKFTGPDVPLDTPAIRRAVERALEAMRECNCIVDVNTGALRKGLNAPYPAPWLLRLAAHEFGLGVCFGDDSHAVADVGAGIPEAREYLLRNGVRSITTLARESGGLVHAVVPLE
jgi:histidinol-phosphatase (PHP family)